MFTKGIKLQFIQFLIHSLDKKLGDSLFLFLSNGKLFLEDMLCYDPILGEKNIFVMLSSNTVITISRVGL